MSDVWCLSCLVFHQHSTELCARIAELEAENADLVAQLDVRRDANGAWAKLEAIAGRVVDVAEDDLRAKLAASEAMVSQMATAHEYRVRQHEVTEDKLAASEKLVGELLRLSEPWSLLSILETLAEAADHLLTVHDCDRHGWEGVSHARDAARSVVAALSKVTP